MGHSLIVSEPPSFTIGMLVGGVFLLISLLFGADGNTAWWVGTISMTIVNFGIGAPINIATIDLLGFLVARPISPAVSAELLYLII